jgi:carboxyvinyl-carboxyphosphonate phosphorylmutase
MKVTGVKSLIKKIHDKNSFIVLPGVYDSLGAKIVEKVGFDAMFQTGYGSAASLLGMPDFGLLNAGETLDNARRIIRSVNLPVIVDVDTGYGNPLTVWRIVNDLIAYGASGIFLEDQLWPKRCGHMSGKEVITLEEFLPKLRAALDARIGHEFIIVARTDARAPLGLDKAIERGNLYYKEGADVIFVEAPLTIEELKEIAMKIPAPLVANMIENGVTPNLSANELKQMGYRIAVFPLSGLYGATYAMKKIFSSLKKTGSTQDCRDIMVNFGEFNELVELKRFMDMDRKYSVGANK